MLRKIRNEKGSTTLAVFICLLLLTLVFAQIPWCAFGGFGDSKQICIEGNCSVYDEVGVFTLDDKDPKIKYKANIGNIIFGCIFFQTIWVPIVAFGLWLYEPVGPKSFPEEPIK